MVTDGSVENGDFPTNNHTISRLMMAGGRKCDHFLEGRQFGDGSVLTLLGTQGRHG